MVLNKLKVPRDEKHFRKMTNTENTKAVFMPVKSYLYCKRNYSVDFIFQELLPFFNVKQSSLLAYQDQKKCRQGVEDYGSETCVFPLM